MNLFVTVAWIALFPVAVMAAGDPIRCAGTGIRVPDWSTKERDLACSASAAAIAFLEAAGLVYHTDQLTIAPLLREGDEQDQHVIGRYDVRRNEILVLTYEASIFASRRHPPAFGMPMSPALWQSVISHETAHAVAEQNFAAGARSPAASEYIAAVVQLGTLPPDLRRAILDRYSAQGFGDASQISLLAYEIDPAVFAVMAYRHYAALGDRGPAFIARLLREGLNQ